MRHSDDWIESRVRWRWRHARGFCRNTVLFADAAEPVREIVDTLLPAEVGIPLLVAFDSNETWTVIATRAVVGRLDGQSLFKAVDAIHCVKPIGWPPSDEELRRYARKEIPLDFEGLKQRKRSWDHLAITDLANRTQTFWVPKGGEAFEIWTLVQMIAAMETPR